MPSEQSAMDLEHYEDESELPDHAWEVVNPSGIKGSRGYWVAALLYHTLTIMLAVMVVGVIAPVYVPGVESQTAATLIEALQGQTLVPLPGFLTTTAGVTVVMIGNAVGVTAIVIPKLWKAWRFVISDEILALQTERGEVPITVERLEAKGTFATVGGEQDG